MLLSALLDWWRKGLVFGGAVMAGLMLVFGTFGCGAEETGAGSTGSATNVSVQTSVPSTSPDTPSAANATAEPTAPAAEPSPVPSRPSLAPWRETAVVAHVIDGDTIELASGVRVRYIGVDTAEAAISGQPVGCFGSEASARNQALVEGKTVELEKDVSETDQYGRLLRYVYVDGVMVNEQLVREGYAQVSTFPPDVKYVDLFLAAQEEARNAGRGLWGDVCQVSPTAQPTAPPAVSGGCPQGCTAPPPGCAIKGNISQSSGEKIYHVPGGEFYEPTVINPSAGERWFCTEQEAVANGWRRSQR